MSSSSGGGGGGWNFDGRQSWMFDVISALMKQIRAESQVELLFPGVAFQSGNKSPVEGSYCSSQPVIRCRFTASYKRRLGQVVSAGRCSFYCL